MDLSMAVEHSFDANRSLIATILLRVVSIKFHSRVLGMKQARSTLMNYEYQRHFRGFRATNLSLGRREEMRQTSVLSGANRRWENNRIR